MIPQLFLAFDDLKEHSKETLDDVAALSESGEPFGIKFNLDAALALVGGQLVGGHVVGAVDAPGDDRAIRIPLQEVDDDLLPDAWKKDAAPLLSGPAIVDTYPAGTILVRFPLLVPMELHFDPAILIRPNLFA